MLPLCDQIEANQKNDHNGYACRRTQILGQCHQVSQGITPFLPSVLSPDFWTRAVGTQGSDNLTFKTIVRGFCRYDVFLPN